MLRITTKFPATSEENNGEYDIDSNVKLFYEAYNKMEYLTLGESKSLHNFGTLLRDQGYFSAMKGNNSSEIDCYSQCSEKLCSTMELKKTKRKTIIRK